MRKILKPVILFLVLVSIVAVSYVYAQQETEKPAASIRQDSGTYLSQIDPHTIEIGISGVPEELASRAFQLSSRVQEEIAGYGLQEGDQVKFSYTVAKQGQVTIMTITAIEKI